MVAPGKPSKPRAQQKFPHRERRIASWGTFCVPKTKRLLNGYLEIKGESKNVYHDNVNVIPIIPVCGSFAAL